MRLNKLSNIELNINKIESNLLCIISVSGRFHNKSFGNFYGLPVIEFFIDVETGKVSNLPDDFDITEMLDIIKNISITTGLVKNNKCNINMSLLSDGLNKNLCILNINECAHYILLDRENLSANIILNEDRTKWKEMHSDNCNIEII